MKEQYYYLLIERNHLNQFHISYYINLIVDTFLSFIQETTNLPSNNWITFNGFSPVLYYFKILKVFGDISFIFYFSLIHFLIE